jgi:hypothetical protein
MKKIQSTDEAGRSMAQKRYGKIDSQSKHGHSEMGQNLRSKFEMQVGGAPQFGAAPPGIRPGIGIPNGGRRLRGKPSQASNFGIGWGNLPQNSGQQQAQAGVKTGLLAGIGENERVPGWSGGQWSGGPLNQGNSDNYFSGYFRNMLNQGNAQQNLGYRRGGKAKKGK